MGRSIGGTLRDYLFKQDAQRANTLGGRRTHFYARAARGVQQPRMRSDGLVVSIASVGLGQRYFGGPIKPVSGTSKYLTIPATAEAYGKRAREFKNLRFILFASGAAALVERAATKLRRTSSGFKAAGNVGGKVFFWLVKSVTQKPDESVLPKPEEMTMPALTAASQFITRIWQRQGKATT